MTRPPDLPEATKALVDELQRLPGSDAAIFHLYVLTQGLARRTN